MTREGCEHMDDTRSDNQRELQLNSALFLALYLAVMVLGILAILFVAANLHAVIYWFIVILVALAVMMIVLSVLSMFIAIPFFLSKGEEVQSGDYDMDVHEYPGEDRRQGRIR